MRVELTETGCLRVIAETPLESFALAKWHEEFIKETECRVTLHIRTTEKET